MATSNATLRFLSAVALAASVLIATLSGCGSVNDRPLGSYERAATYRDMGKYREAVDAYAQFLRRSPADSLAARAQFEKASSYVELKEYPLASVEFQILRQEYPTSAYVEEALYRECEALLMQVGRIERDVTPALKARERFLNFLEVYPMSPWTGQVHDHLTAISDLVVEKKMREAALYGRLKKHEAAAIVLDRVLATERRSTLRDRVYWERAQLARKLGQDEVDVLSRLLDELPDGEHADDARRRLAEIRPADSP